MTPCWDCDALGFPCVTHKHLRLPRKRMCRHPLCAVYVPLERGFCDAHLVAGLVVCGCGREFPMFGEPMRYQAPPEHGCA